MNNRALVNLKQIMPATGQAMVTSDFVIRPEILKPFGWHTLARIKVAKLVLQVTQYEAWLALGHSVAVLKQDRPDWQQGRDTALQAIRAAFKSRHNPPKGWKA